VGLSHSKDSFYAEVQPERRPVPERLQQNWRAWVTGGVLCSEMEAAALFVLASVLGKRAGGLMVALNREATSLDPLCKTAVEGIRRLIALDRAAEAAPQRERSAA
jgi:uridine phosphorylase